MRNKQRKKLQSKVNKIVYILNQNIANDNLWQGRFTIKQHDCHFRNDTEKDYAAASFWFILTDHKTGVQRNEYLYTSTAIINSFDYVLWRAANDFVCEQIMEEERKR